MTERQRVYEQPRPLSREEAEAAFATDMADAICIALVSLAFYDPDWRWVQDQLLRFVTHSDGNIRMAAAVCFGHLARIHRQLDWRVVVPLLQQLMRDDRYAGGNARSALADIRHSMPQTRRLIGKLD
jgi:hypothetical protein